MSQDLKAHPETNANYYNLHPVISQLTPVISVSQPTPVYQSLLKWYHRSGEFANKDNSKMESKAEHKKITSDKTSLQ